MERTWRQPIGRFISKSNLRLRKCVTMSHFSLMDVCDNPVTSHDNTRNNLILTQLHDEDELEQGVKLHTSIDKPLIDPRKGRPVLRPLDFTKDWEKQNKRTKRKASRSGDEDEDDFEMEIENQMRKMAEKDSDSVSKEKKPEAAEIESPSEEVPAEVVAQEPAVAEEKKESPTPELQHFQESIKSMDEIGKALNNLNQENFVAISPKDYKKEEQKVVMPEEKAIQEYREQVYEKTDMKDHLQKLEEEAKNKGYMEGYKQAEEKATLMARQQVNQMADKMKNVVTELQFLKKQLLEGAQENFFEICQAISETVMKREFSMNPNEFYKVVQSTIRESIHEGKFKVLVNDETLKKINSYLEEENKGMFFVDTNLKDWDFRVESDSNVIKGDLSQRIQGFLDSIRPAKSVEIKKAG